MSEREPTRAREEGGDSQTVGSREGEKMDEAHSESPGEGATPEAGHPVGGEGAGMPEEGAGRTNEQSTPPMPTEDQGDPTHPSGGETE
jgi:hypothetical protein